MPVSAPSRAKTPSQFSVDQKSTERPARPSPRTVLSLLLNSVTVWCVLGLLVLNWAFFVWHADDHLPASEHTHEQIAGRAISYKLQELAAQKANPDILLIGSSLMMSAPYYADFQIAKNDPAKKKALDAFLAKCEQQRISPFQSYHGADYFEQVMTHDGKRPSIFGLTCAACMASDAYLLLSRALAEKKPKSVIWAVAPRDFVDNVVPPAGQTPAYKIADNLHFLPNEISAFTSIEQLGDKLLRCTWSVYGQRSNVSHLLTYLTATSLHRPTSLSAAVEKKNAPALPVVAVPTVPDKPTAAAPPAPAVAAAPELPASAATAVPAPPAPAVAAVPELPAPAAQPVPSQLSLSPVVSAASVPALKRAPIDQLYPSPDAMEEPGWKMAFLPQYKDYYKRYNPLSLKRMNDEMTALRQAIKMSREQNVELMVLNMPLPRRHMALMPGGLYKAYYEQIRQICKEEHVRLIDMNQPDEYENEDWVDSLHLGPTGGVKFIQKLAAQLK